MIRANKPESHVCQDGSLAWNVVFTFNKAGERKEIREAVSRWCYNNMRGKALVYGSIVYRFQYEDDAQLCYLAFS